MRGENKKMNREATECWRLLFGLVDDFRELAARRNRNMEIAEFANVTVGQMRVLKAIFAFQEKYPDGVMLKQLAEKVNLTPGAASIIVDTLVKQGVLDRRTSEVDRRAVRIGLSEQGKKIVACYGDFFTGATADFLAEIPRDDYETMMKLLTKFNQNILKMKEEDEKQ